MPKPKPRRITTKPLNYPAGVSSRYAATLVRYTTAMTRETERELRELFSRPYMALDGDLADGITEAARVLVQALIRRWGSYFDAIIPPTVKHFTQQVDQSSRVAVRTSLRELSKNYSLSFKDVDQSAVNALEAIVAENATLIKSIPEQYMGKVAGAVFRSITTGNGLADLVPELQKQAKITKNRAKLIAHDQTRKSFSALNVIRAQEAGLTKFSFQHSRGGLYPRKLHVRYSKNQDVFEIAKPPVIDDRTGERGFPGQLINCKCRCKFVIEF